MANITLDQLNAGVKIIMTQKTGSDITNLYPVTALANVMAVVTDGSGNESVVNANEYINDILAMISANEESIANATIPDDTEGVSNYRYLRNDKTWNTIPTATTEEAGVTTLSDAVDSESSDTAATSYAVKQAYDLANAAVPQSSVGIANGVTPLDSDGLVPSSYLPSYVDDVIDGVYVDSATFNDEDGNALTPESGKIYVDTTTEKTYRWSGSMYVEISESLALGVTHESAFYGDYGQIAYEYALANHMEQSENNGYIKFDGQEYLVYTDTEVTLESLGIDKVENLSGLEIINTYASDEGVTALASATQNGIMSKEYAEKLDGLMNVYIQEDEPDVADGVTALWLKITD